MTQKEILHVIGWDKKFVKPFRDFVRQNFPEEKHKFIVYGDVPVADLQPSNDTIFFSSLLKNMLVLSIELYSAKKVVLHGLFSNHLLYVLAIQPWLLKKCFWVMWGGDLYVHDMPAVDWRRRKDEFFRRVVISRVGNLVTQVKGDYELARQWYGAKGRYYECFVYPSNLFRDHLVDSVPHDSINIQLGNSADPANNHIEALEKLAAYKNDNIKIFVPLSYGDEEYAQEVISCGRAIFGERFVPITKFFPLTEYLEFLSKIDIAVFNHKRQQAMGNITTLLGMGKKVFIRSDITSWSFYRELGVSVFDLNEFGLGLLDQSLAKTNHEKISEYFSEERLLAQLGKIFQ